MNAGSEVAGPKPALVFHRLTLVGGQFVLKFLRHATETGYVNAENFALHSRECRGLEKE